MKLSSIPQIYRHLGRWYEILTVLSKYELAAWIGRLGPEFAKDLLKTRGGEAIARLPWETRLRLALIELGPTFIKFGQILSTRPDLIGFRLAEELQELQTNVPADPPEVVRSLLENELGRPPEELFAEFAPTPIASASIGQVHFARLRSGESVVVKVLHLGIEEKVNVDMEILTGLAALAEGLPEFRDYRPSLMAAEFQRTMRRELDFGRELRNIEQFAANFRNDPTVCIPKVYPELSSRRVLVMEAIRGTKFSDAEGRKALPLDTEELARRCAAIYLKMIFDHGFYHCDPHPGNLLAMRDGRIGLLDFGMVGRIDPWLREYVGEILLALSNLDAEHMTAMILRVSKTPPNLDRSALCLDVADFLSYYAGQSLEKFDLSGALTEMIEQIRGYRILLPARIIMLLKALIILEGTGRLLSPKFSLVEIIRPYRRKLLLQRFSPYRRLVKLHRLYAEAERLLDLLPQGVADLLDRLKSEHFDVRLEHRGLEPAVNRLILGVLGGALFIGGAVLMASSVPPLIDLPPLLPGVSAPGTAAITVAVILGLRLWRAIGKSGRLERKRHE